MADGGDDTARVTLTRIVHLDMIDGYAGGWKQIVLLEVDRMRAEMPYADQLEIRLTAERRPS